MSKVFKASAPSFTHSPTQHPLCAGRSSIPRCPFSFLRWPHFNQLRLFSLSFLRWPHFKQTQLFSLSPLRRPHFRDIRLFTAHFRPCPGRIADISVYSLPSFLPSCAGRTSDKLDSSLPHCFPALAAFPTRGRNFQPNSMSSGVPQDGMPPCFHMMHAGKPLSSHGHPRPPVKAFHLNAFKIYTRKLGLYSHKPEQVSSSLVRYSKQLYSLNPRARGMQRQIEGLQQWKKLDSGEYKHLGIGELLCVYSECFDALFWGGTSEWALQTPICRQ